MGWRRVMYVFPNSNMKMEDIVKLIKDGKRRGIGNGYMYTAGIHRNPSVAVD